MIGVIYLRYICICTNLPAAAGPLALVKERRKAVVAAAAAAADAQGRPRAIGGGPCNFKVPFKVAKLAKNSNSNEEQGDLASS